MEAAGGSGGSASPVPPNGSWDAPTRWPRSICWGFDFSPFGCLGFYFRWAPRAAPGSPGFIQEPPFPSGTEPPGCDAERSGGHGPKFSSPASFAGAWLSCFSLIWLRRQLEAEAGELLAESVTQEVKNGEGPLGITDMLAGCRQPRVGRRRQGSRCSPGPATDRVSSQGRPGQDAAGT